MAKSLRPQQSPKPLWAPEEPGVPVWSQAPNCPLVGMVIVTTAKYMQLCLSTQHVLYKPNNSVWLVL